MVILGVLLKLYGDLKYLRKEVAIVQHNQVNALMDTTALIKKVLEEVSSSDSR